MVNFAFLGCILHHTGYHTDYLKLASFSDRKTFTKRSPAVNIYQITTEKRTTKYRLSFYYIKWKNIFFKRSKETSACCYVLLLKDVFFISLKSSHLESLLQQSWIEWYCMKVMDMPRFYNICVHVKYMTIFFQMCLKMLQFLYFSSFLACKGIQFS